MLEPSSSSGQDQTAPIDPAIVQKAAQWMARLWADDVSQADHTACQQWRAAHPDHERAWNRLQVFESKLDKVPQHATPVLLQTDTKAKLPRRRALRAMLVAALAIGAVPVVRNTQTWRRFSADYGTDIGVIREITLEDGSHLLLNTASAVDIRFDRFKRELVLLEGEILVTTHPDPVQPARPFLVRNRHGHVQALGTRFSLRQFEDKSHVSVFDGAVRITPALAPEAAQEIGSGQHSAFSTRHVSPPSAASTSDTAWTQGMLVAEDMRIDQFLLELSRYRPGLLNCAPEVAGLSVTGVFPLNDTDRALANLALALPIHVKYRTPYWVTVLPR